MSATMLTVVLINRNFARMWAGSAISSLGDQIFNTTIFLWLATVLLKGERLAPVAVGGVVMAVSVATIVVGPIAGVLVDRWDKRRTMLATDAIRAVLVGALTVFAFLPAGTLSIPITLAMIYTVILLNSAASRFYLPAWFTLTSDVVPDEAGRGKAIGLVQATSSAMLIIGPPLAAPLLFTAGYQWALLINAISFALSYVAIRGVRPPIVETPQEKAADVPPSSMWREFQAGLSFLHTSRVVTTMFLSAVIVTAGVGALNTLDVFFVTENLNTKAEYYGFLGTAEGIGLVVGSVLTGWLVAKLGGVRVFWVGLIVAGVIIILYARQTSLVPAMVILSIGGAAMGAVNAAIGPITMGAIPRELMGRVVSVFAPVQQIASIGSALLVSWLAATVLNGLSVDVGPFTFGRLDTIFTVAGVIFVIGGIYSGVVLARMREAQTSS